MKVLEIASAGTELDPALRELIDEIMQLHADAAKKDEEAKAINAEQWVEPACPVPAPLLPRPPILSPSASSLM